MDYKKALPIVDRFVSWATPKKVLSLAAVALVLIFSVTLFEQRAQVAELVTARGQEISAAPIEFKVVLNTDLKDHIQELVKRSDRINMIGVLNANLRVNQRDMVYFYSDDPTVEVVWKGFLDSRGTIQPIFNSSEKNNLQMVSVINGEFSCQKFEDTIINTLMPKLASRMPYVCRVSLPPYYGEFSGFIMIGLTGAPSDAELSELRIEAVRLATEIYFKAIAHRRP